MKNYFVVIISLLTFFDGNFSNGVDPFYLIAVISKDGKSTLTQECIGVLLTYQVIFAPASCLHFKNVFSNGDYIKATGVFIDYRATKTYSENPNIFELTSFTYSSDIQIDKDFHKDTLVANNAYITLPVPFSKDNPLKIHPPTFATSEMKYNLNDLNLIAYFVREPTEVKINVQNLFESNGNPVQRSVIPGAIFSIAKKANAITYFMGFW